MFNITDDRLIERIAKEHPALSAEDSERIYAMIQQKLGQSVEKEQFHEAVSGVERYRRPVWHRVAGIAAAFAAVVGIAGSTFLMHRSTPAPIQDTPLSATDDAGRNAAAVILTDSFLEASSLIDGRTAAEHSDRQLKFISDDDPTVIYSPVTDSRFAVPADVTALLEDIVTEEYMAELRENGGGYFSADIDTLSGVTESRSTPSFRMFGGELYTAVRETSAPEYTGDPVITDSSPSRFTVTRSDGDELVFTILWDGTQWRIDDIERNTP